MKRKIFIGMLFSLFSIQLMAQVTAAKLQASGLTCALCAKSIFTNLTSLPFVENVDTDLNASAFLIKFKGGSEIDPGLLRKKVEDAGFFVSNLELEISFQKQAIANNTVVSSSGASYQFFNTKSSQLDGTVKVQVLEKEYLSAKEYKKIAADLPSAKEQSGSSRLYRVRVVK